MAADPIKVLVVDDAVVVRRVVADALAQDGEIEVIGVAANGRIALQMLPSLKPDVVTLDVEMPEMDGIATLIELRRTHPHLPVIMFSTLTADGAAITIEALSRGASDYVAKPTGTGSLAESVRRVRDELVPKVKALAGRRPERRPVVTAPVSAPLPGTQAPRHNAPIECVVVGVSTGGPNALAEIVPALPADFPVPILLVQHMPPVFTRLLAERLDSRSALDVREASGGEIVERGQIWIAPGDHHMEVRTSGKGPVLTLNQGPQENSCRPAVDVLFRSAANVFGNRVLGVVLTGMGRDGLIGCEVIRKGGGQVIVQDEATSVVWGMPGLVAEAGLAHAVVPLQGVADEITRLVKAGGGVVAAGRER